jgi:branched-chain amino acid transport system permease protein
MDLILVQLFNGISLGMIYVLMAVGLTVIFGMLNIINFAHGAVYAVGAYLAFQCAVLLGEWSGSFWLAILISPLLTAALGALLEVLLIRKMYDAEHNYQILLTFGITLILQEVIIMIWGPVGKSVPMPKQLAGVVDWGSFSFPEYRIFLIIFIAAICLISWLLIEKTSYGSIIRAGTENRNMVNSLGINIYTVFTVIFAIGMGLAALAGAVSLPMRGAMPLMGDSVLTLCFVVVVIGGMGSFTGAILGGLIVGIVESMMALVWPPGAMIATFAAMALVILIWPRGLLGFR